MQFDLRRPCDNCPFRTDIRPFLRRDRAEEIAASLIEAQECFPCHKTVDYDEDGEAMRRSGEQHCAGAAILLLHMERPNQLMRIAMRLGFFDPSRLDMNAPVFREVEDWIDAQEA